MPAQKPASVASGRKTVKTKEERSWMEKVWKRKKAEMRFQGGYGRTAAVMGKRAEKHSKVLLCLVSKSYLHCMVLVSDESLRKDFITVSEPVGLLDLVFLTSRYPSTPFPFFH